MPELAAGDAGHWARGSEMPRKYGFHEGVVDLANTEFVRRQVKHGWRMASAATLPMDPVSPSVHPTLQVQFLSKFAPPTPKVPDAAPTTPCVASKK